MQQNGCGEGKDAVFLARNGYIVTAFDLSETGIEKGKKLAERNHSKPERRQKKTFLTAIAAESHTSIVWIL